MSNLRSSVSVFAVVAGLSAACSASAQLPANNGGGRALDANGQVGSGGTNRIENQIDFAARNDLITGNVANGFGFQGDIDYSAPGTFQDALGSSDLFDFRAESLTSSPLVSGQFGSQNVRGGNIVVFENFTTIPASRTINNPTRFAPTGGAFRVNRDFSEASPFELALDRNAATGLNNRFDPTPGTNTLGIFQIQDGTALAVTADALTGVRRRSIPAFEPPANTSRFDPNATPGLDDETRLEGFNVQPNTNLVPTAPLDGNNNTFNQGPADNAELLARNAAQNRFTDATGLVKPSLQIGQIAINRANASNETLEQRAQQIQESIFGPADTPGAAGTPGAPGAGAPGAGAGAETQENAYTQLLDEIREQAKLSAAERLEARQRQGLDPRPEWMRALDEPSEAQVEEAEDTLAATLRRIREASATAREQRQTAEAQGQEDGGEAPSAVNELLSDLSYNVRLDTLVAERESRVNDLFAQAEQQLASGQFLNAERTYRQIRIEAADNPLGQAGLINAQLGAGMIRSAAFNLRDLFEEHPELIATRYGQNLLPPQDRLEWLRNELQRMIDTQNTSIDPGLMMAYLGHQIESRPLVRQGLAIAQNAAPIDPLLPVLRSIWLEQKPAASIESSK